MNLPHVMLTSLPRTTDAWSGTDASLVQHILSSPDVMVLVERTLAYLRQRFVGADVTLVWWLNGAATPSKNPDRAVPQVHQDLIAQAYQSQCGAAVSGDGKLLAAMLSLPDPHVGAVAVVQGDETLPGHEQWADLADVLRPCMTSAFEIIRLRQAEVVQKALFEIADLSGSGLDMSDMMDELHKIVNRLMYAENLYIALYDKDKDSIRFIYYRDVVDPDPIDENENVYLSQIERGLTWHLIRGAKPLMGSSPELRTQVDGTLEDHGPDSVDWMGVPILDDDGYVRGVLVVQSYIERPRYTLQDQALLTFVGSHIFNALERRQARDDLEQRVENRTHELTQEVEARERGERLQKTLFKIAELATVAVSQDIFYREVHAIVGHWMNSNNFYVAEVSEDGTMLSFPYSVDERDPPRTPRPIGRSMTDWVIRTRQPVLATRDVINRLKEAGEVEEMGAQSVCWLGVPLIVEDKVIGALAVQSYTPGQTYTANDQELLTFISYQIANGLDRLRAAQQLREANVDLEWRVQDRTKQLMEQIEVREQMEYQLKHEVLHDNLTGLPNRAYLREHLVRVMTRFRRHPEQLFAVLFMDLDRFKVINDSAGHLVGDQLLQEVATRFSACVRTSDVVARLGGDEFAMILDDLNGPEDAIHIAQRAIDALKTPVLVPGTAKELFTGVSVGVVMCDFRYNNPDDLLRDADVAMYRAKANSHQRFEVFDEKLHQEAMTLLDLENDLRQALSQNEFTAYLQPIVRLDDRSTQGYEALIRWEHPTRGLVLPGAFLKAAETAGCMEDIDWVMLDNVMKGPAQLLPRGHYINVNISPRHFRDANFDEKFLSLMTRYHLDGRHIRIEVTEGALVDNTQQACDILNRLRDNGILMALDDFGTGYSSLSYVHQFPLHTLKIDRSFVTGLGQTANGLSAAGSAAVVRSILALAQSLNLDVVAEGIETEAQRTALLELGCVYG